VEPQSSYRDKVAIITGGASGIGAALAKHLAHERARVVIADRQVELAESLAVAIRSNGGTAVAVQLDVRELSSMAHVVTDTVARWGAVDYFFNNAGIGLGGDASQYSHTDWNDVLTVNLHGVVHGIEAVYPVMIRQQSGHIINTASMAGLIGTAGSAAYCATKHAVVGLSKSLRAEAKRHGVRVSVLCPGAIRTPILQGGKYGRMLLDQKELDVMWEQARPLDPDVMAPQIARAVLRNEMFIVLPKWWKLFWYFERLAPVLSLKLSELHYSRMHTRVMRPAVQPPQPEPAASPSRARSSGN